MFLRGSVFFILLMLVMFVLFFVGWVRLCGYFMIIRVVMSMRVSVFW